MEYILNGYFKMEDFTKFCYRKEQQTKLDQDMKVRPSKKTEKQENENQKADKNVGSEKNAV